MTYYKKAFCFLIIFCSTSQAELVAIDDQDLAASIGQAGISIDRNVRMQADSLVLDLAGSNGVSVLTSNRHDANSDNDSLFVHLDYNQLKLDINSLGHLQLTLPQQLILGQYDSFGQLIKPGISSSFYMSADSTITETTYQQSPETYRIYVNSISEDAAFDDFTLTISGAQFSNNSNQYSSNYLENETVSSTDGAYIDVTVNNNSNVNLSLVSADQENCDNWIFQCDGTDNGEIIVVDSKGDLVARSGNVGQFNAELQNLSLTTRKEVAVLGSNYFFSAEISGRFNITGNVQLFSGTPVEVRY